MAPRALCVLCACVREPAHGGVEPAASVCVAVPSQRSAVLSVRAQCSAPPCSVPQGGCCTGTQTHAGPRGRRRTLKTQTHAERVHGWPQPLLVPYRPRVRRVGIGHRRIVSPRIDTISSIPHAYRIAHGSHRRRGPSFGRACVMPWPGSRVASRTTRKAQPLPWGGGPYWGADCSCRLRAGRPGKRGAGGPRLG